MNRRIGLVAAMAVLLIAGLAFATATEDTSEEENSGCPFGKPIGFGMGGIPAEVREELGLPEDATQEEFREAMQEHRMAEIREKLGLPEDATDEEVREALKEWREENRTLIQGMHRGGFRHKGFGGRMRGFGCFGR